MRTLPLITAVVLLFTTSCSAFNALLPQMATLAAPPPPTATRAPRATRTPRPATETPPAATATRVRPTRTPLPTRTPAPTSEATATDAPVVSAAPGGFQETEGEEGWRRYASDTAGFAITLPESWQNITVEDSESMRTELDRIDAGLLRGLSTELDAQSGSALKFAAVDIAGVDFNRKSAPVVYVLKRTLAAGTTLAQVLPDVKREITALPEIDGGILTENAADIPATDEAAVLTYKMNYDHGGDPAPASINFFVALKGENLFGIAMQADEAAALDFAGTFEVIARRFEVIE